MHRPKVSIAVPCFNASATVDITLRSILQQDLSNIEVIALDDASTDDTPAILGEWARRDPRVRAIFLKENTGIGEVRNRALLECTGEYVAFVDADDWVTPSYHRSLVDAADDLNVDFVKSDHVRVAGTERSIVRAPLVIRGRPVSPLHLIERLDRATMVDYAFVWCGVFRRKFLVDARLNFGSGLRTAEDRIFTWQCHLTASSYACISECGYLYRKESTPSLTQIGDARQLDFLDCIEQTLDLLERSDNASEPIWQKAYRQALALVVFHFERRERFSPEVWREYCRRTRTLIHKLDAERLHAVYVNFGDRRTDIIEGLRTGSIAAREAGYAN